VKAEGRRKKNREQKNGGQKNESRQAEYGLTLNTTPRHG
jgi:hypothetical protein